MRLITCISMCVIHRSKLNKNEWENTCPNKHPCWSDETNCNDPQLSHHRLTISCNFKCQAQTVRVPARAMEKKCSWIQNCPLCTYVRWDIVTHKKKVQSNQLWNYSTMVTEQASYIQDNRCQYRVQNHWYYWNGWDAVTSKNLLNICTYVYIDIYVCVFALTILCRCHLLTHHDWLIMYNVCALLVKQLFSYYL